MEIKEYNPQTEEEINFHKSYLIERQISNELSTYDEEYEKRPEEEERQGKIDEMDDKMIQLYREETDDILKTITSLVERVINDSEND